MKQRMKRGVIAWAFNIAGIILILLVPIIGPLPGPGGTLLLILGLNILSIHNPRIKRLRDYVIHKGLSLTHIIFPNIRKYQIAWDIVSILGITIPSIVWLNLDPVHTWQKFILTGIISIFGFCLLYNVRRQERIIQCINKQIKKRKRKS